ncbi:hypothetical protein LNTAR_20588 [Lentisphaera araneosa HTCC2155]|uniref:Uncharacterized protein n=1 Tax=Lentisphaera araneosa HTCC2155 TaxID=313628 RepID=A6DL40_9BACT|nr:hypothetical protein [Lentisphaera araneosa]EDM27642.1 hypothetical protein LNTAR_20588 [Lentisphaera araneosa HTCC2155]
MYQIQKIIAIGPPLLNLEAEFSPITLKVGNKIIPFKYKFNEKKIAVLEAKLADELQFPCQYEIHIGNQIYSVNLEAIDRPKGPTLICIQKDNNVQWIKDWISYYTNEFGVKNIVIYDNASTYPTPLKDELAGLAKVIDWPFPYGIFYKHANKYAQMGALNHFKLKFGGECKIFNFDIDELLVCKSDEFKKKILSSPYMRFDSYVVNYDPSLPQESSFKDYVYREKHVHGSAYKYVFDSALEGLMSVHYFNKQRSGFTRFLSKNNVKIPAVDPSQAYFLHYKGISTNWKKHYSDKFKSDCLDKTDLELDLSVQEAFNYIEMLK